MSQNPEEKSPILTLAEMEILAIEGAMAHFQGNKTKVAEALGITIKTLYNKLHEYELIDKYRVNTPSKKAGDNGI